MAQCELCGRLGNTVTAAIEGVDLTVCNECARFGQVKRSVPVRSFQQSKPIREEPTYALADDFASLIRSARERKNMTQEDFAKFLQEKEGQLAKWEQGSLKPGIDTARKLERVLGLRLVVLEESAAQVVASQKKPDVFTLGDFVKVRKR